MRTYFRWAELLEKTFEKYTRTVMSSVYAPSCITIFIFLVAGAYLEHTNRIENHIELHQSVSMTVAETGTRLQREIETNLEAIRLISRAIALQPGHEIADFRNAAAATFSQPNALSQLTLVTDDGTTVSMTKNNAPMAAIPGISKFMTFKAMQGGVLNTTMPLFSYQIALENARSGFFVRYPVFQFIDGRNVQDGYVFGVIDQATLFTRTDFTDSRDGIAYALQLQTEYFTVNKVAFGNVGFDTSDVVFTSIDLPSGKWILSAAPEGGWNRDPENTWVLRLWIALACMLGLVPVIYATRLFRDRQENSTALLEREAELDITRRRLMLALEASKTGIWEVVPSTKSLYWDSRMRALHGAEAGSPESSLSLWRRIANPADYKRISEAIKSTIMTGSEFNVQYSIACDDGRRRFMRAIGSLELTSDGLVGIAGICRDVTDDVALTEDLRRAKELADAKNADLQAALQRLSLREQELETTTRRLDMALDAYACGVWEAELDGGNIYWDDRMYTLCGLDNTGGTLALSQWVHCIHPDDRERVLGQQFSDYDAGSKFSNSFRIVRTDGCVRHLRTISTLNVTSAGKRSLYGVAIDVTEDVLLNEQMVAAKEAAEAHSARLQIALHDLSQSRRDQMETAHRLHVALTAFDCGVWEAHPGKGSIWDQRMHSLYGIPYKDGRVSFDRWQHALHPDDRESAMQEYSLNSWSEGNRVRERRILLEDGSIRHIRSHGTSIVGGDGQVIMTGVAFDITRDVLLTEQLKQSKDSAEQRAEEIALVKNRILHNSLHDSLTGLANRRYLDEELERLSKERRNSSEQIAILHLDLDRFKQINDTMGHAAGDAMLVHASHVLKSQCRESDLVARIGGDEFVVLVTDKNSEAGLARLATRIIEQMRQPIIHQGHECRFGVSIGIAQERMSRDDARQLLVNADIALYRAKEKGRNRYEFFSDDLAAEIINTKRTADEILSALENNEFVPWYQPQFDCQTQKLSGLEALVRWNHPTKGVLTPDKFMKTAEELNAVCALDRIVLEKSMADRMTWAAQGLIIPKISVNVSARRLQDERLLEALGDLQIVPGQISFELIESIFLDDNDTVMTANIERIKSLGIDIEIDDFGTGYTSIVSLLKLKPKRLKIDRQLVSPILESREERSMVKSIIEIGRSLNIETVAEGVETPEHGEMLKLLGCNYLQGFALGRPMPASALVEFCKTEPWRKAA